LLLSATTASAAREPTLRIEKTSPLVVSGSGFGASERIRLRISGGNGQRLVTADAKGSFAIRLGTLRAIRCAAFVVVAVGADGHTASARLPRTACLPVPADASTK
jgi:hypothetical protein